MTIRKGRTNQHEVEMQESREIIKAKQPINRDTVSDFPVDLLFFLMIKFLVAKQYKSILLNYG